MASDRGRLERSGWKTDFDLASVALGETESGGPPKDGIPAVDTPAFVTIEAVRSWLDPRLPVIGLDVAA